MITNRRFLVLLIVALACFIVLSQGMGEWYGMYNKVWWWDDSLHAVSGVLFTFVGLYVLRILEKESAKRLHPMTIALFALCFAITCCVIWEIYEFVIDILFNFTMQQWNMPSNAIVMGVAHQGMGLRDTMSDLILAMIGALVTSGGMYTYSRRVGSKNR